MVLSEPPSEPKHVTLELTGDEAATLMWAIGRGGTTGGSFREKLWNALAAVGVTAGYKHRFGDGRDATKRKVTSPVQGTAASIGRPFVWAEERNDGWYLSLSRTHPMIGPVSKSAATAVVEQFNTAAR